jgi:SAM-dependent methyltransferase
VSAGSRNCWICGSSRLALEKAGDFVGDLTSDSFAITDAHYGQTAAIYRCEDCGFLECPDLADALKYYEALEDPAYEEGRRERRLQMSRLLRGIHRERPGGRLLDVGAGSGMLVEEARLLGFEAEGIEPSRWLQERAAERGLPVHLGTLPSPAVRPPYDVVTLIDVIEHVSDPVGLLREAAGHLAPEGLVAVVTPDVGSLAARLFGRRWWHFRVAHIGYFSRATLESTLGAAGLEVLRLSRPAWYFGADYLLKRLSAYLPGGLRLPAPGAVRRLTLPLNLRDSFLALCRRKAAAA